MQFSGPVPITCATEALGTSSDAGDRTVGVQEEFTMTDPRGRTLDVLLRELDVVRSEGSQGFPITNFRLSRHGAIPPGTSPHYTRQLRRACRRSSCSVASKFIRTPCAICSSAKRKSKGSYQMYRPHATLSPQWNKAISTDPDRSIPCLGSHNPVQRRTATGFAEKLWREVLPRRSS